MGGFGDDGYTGRSQEEIESSYWSSVDEEYGEELEPYEGSFARALFAGFALAVAQNQEEDLERLYNSIFVQDATGEELTKLTAGYGVNRREPIPSTGVVEWTRIDTEGTQIIPKGVSITTELPNPIEFQTTETGEFADGSATVQTNVEAVEGGTEGNVGANRITRMPSPPANVTAVTNPNPTGDPDYTLTNGTQQRQGLDRESDTELRKRFFAATSLGGSATVRAVKEKIYRLGGSPSLTIYTNRETTDNANGNGLPKLSSEIVLYAPNVTDDDIAQAIHDIVAVTARLTSGHNGISKTASISSDVLAQDRPIEWSQANTTALEIDITLVTEDGYAGDDTVKDELVDYIGGTDTEADRIPGLDVGEDVVIDELERRVTNIDGVLGISNLIVDSDGDGADNTTTRSDGLDAYEAGREEVVTLDALSDIVVTT